MEQGNSSLLRQLNRPLTFRLFLLTRLPAAFFAGLRMKEINENKCVVSVPYKWFTKNPFRSTYFACLSMAAEMSTGALCMVHIHGRTPPVSMLVVKFEITYTKKAVGRTDFICEHGAGIKKTIEEAVATGEARTYSARSVGRNAEGASIAEAVITWSFKTKSRK